MNKELQNYKDYIIQLCIVISQHSLGNEDDISLKTIRMNYMFSIVSYLFNHLSEKSFESLVFVDVNRTLYNSSTKPIKDLKKIPNCCICTSKDGFIEPSSFKNYKYKNKLHLKENRYGIDLNKVLSILSEKDKKQIHDTLYGPTKSDWELIHSNENEIIVQIDDVEII